MRVKEFSIEIEQDSLLFTIHTKVTIHFRNLYKPTNDLDISHRLWLFEKKDYLILVLRMYMD